MIINSSNSSRLAAPGIGVIIATVSFIGVEIIRLHPRSVRLSDPSFAIKAQEPPHYDITRPRVFTFYIIARSDMM